MTYKLTPYYDLSNLPEGADSSYCEGVNIGILMCLINLKCQGLDVEVASGARQECSGWWDVEDKVSTVHKQRTE